jgi:DNA modification methylase
MNKIIFGDCRETMRQLASEGVKVQMCVTSPPYFGLRDYGTSSWEGGDPDCNHSISMPTKWNDPKRGTSVLRPEVSHRGGDASHCHLCGGKRIDLQIGLEETPEQYIEAMVEVFRCVKDILADDGVLWVNIGDSYNTSPAGNKTWGNGVGTNKAYEENQIHHGKKIIKSLKPKDLIGIPWMLAFALRADGWYLRQDIIWNKPNPMPESVQDRCTKSHEYIFLLSKSQKYFYDNEAIKEPIQDETALRMLRGVSDSHKNVNGAPGQTPHSMNKPRENVRKEFDSSMGGGGTSFVGHSGYKKADGTLMINENRNKRSVWTVNTKPYKGAHFAVFPEELIEPCILAGSRVGDVVLDPFMGSGTTAQVAQQLGRKYLGCELNPDYKALQDKRVAQQSLELI